MSAQANLFPPEEASSPTEPVELTPVEYYNAEPLRGGSVYNAVLERLAEPGLWLKRDDLYSIFGASGGKARVAYALALKGPGEGLTTCGARTSPQAKRVAAVAKGMGMPCTVHVPSGDISTGPVFEAMELGANVISHTPGYMSVLRKRARDQALEDCYTLIPFGCECPEAVEQTRRQVANLPEEAKRLVVPVGSGMTLAGICHGLEDNENPIPVLGVCVGGKVLKRLDKYAPEGWREFVTLVQSPHDYSYYADEQALGVVRLDPVYEAKCVEYLQPGDVLWLVGYR